jgi:hypothetical protein
MCVICRTCAFSRSGQPQPGEEPGEAGRNIEAIERTGAAWASLEVVKDNDTKAMRKSHAHSASIRSSSVIRLISAARRPSGPLADWRLTAIYQAVSQVCS